MPVPFAEAHREVELVDPEHQIANIMDEATSNLAVDCIAQPRSHLALDDLLAVRERTVFLSVLLRGHDHRLAVRVELRSARTADHLAQHVWCVLAVACASTAPLQRRLDDDQVCWEVDTL